MDEIKCFSKTRNNSKKYTFIINRLALLQTYDSVGKVNWESMLINICPLKGGHALTKTSSMCNVQLIYVHGLL